VVGVSFDVVKDNRAFGDKFDFPFPLLSDPERKMGVAYGACESPAAGFANRISYLIDETGTILRAYPEVKPGEHPAEVLRDIDAVSTRPRAAES
jgi:peroxiredoxin Q/BCP